MKFSWLKLVLWGAFIVIALSGCGNSQEPAADRFGTEPLTLTMFQQSAYLTDQEFTEMFAEPMRSKYPNVTMQLIRNAAGSTPSELIAAGSFPDLIFTAAGGTLYNFLDLNLLADLNDVIKQNKFNVQAFESYIIDELKKMGSQGELYALPFSENFSALFYNIDILDRYAVPHPKDLATIEDIMVLARLVAEKSAGEVMAFNGGSIQQFANPLSLPYVDANDKATLATDSWRKTLELLKAFHSLPGNTYIAPGEAAKQFGEEKIALLAAFGARVGELELLHKNGSTMKWDLSSYPTFPEAPGKRRGLDVHTLSISTTSKNKEAAFAAMSLVLQADAQTKMTRNGRLSGLKDPKIKQQFGLDLASMKGKNVGGIFKATPAEKNAHSRYSAFAERQIGNAFTRLLKDEANANSLLREAEELANQAIASEKSKE